MVTEHHERIAEKLRKIVAKKLPVPKHIDLLHYFDEIAHLMMEEHPLWDISECAWQVDRSRHLAYVKIFSWPEKRRKLFEDTRLFMPEFKQYGVRFCRPMHSLMVLRSLSGLVTEDWLRWLEMYIIYKTRKKWNYATFREVEFQAIRALWSYGKEDRSFWRVAHEYRIKRPRQPEGRRWLGRRLQREAPAAVIVEARDRRWNDLTSRELDTLYREKKKISIQMKREQREYHPESL